MRNEVLRMLPQTVQIALTGIPDAQIEELRLRVGQKPAVLYAGGERPLSVRTVLLQKELQQTLLNASAQSQYAVQEQLRSGYLSLSGGYRLGVCGSAVVQNGCMTGLREISSLALRVPHDIRHPPERLLPYLQESCLLAGAPGSGKTTLLRSCIRALSENRQRVAVVDERLELAACASGVPSKSSAMRRAFSTCAQAAATVCTSRALARAMPVSRTSGQQQSPQTTFSAA